VRIAQPSSTTLTIMAAAVPMLGQRRENPWVNFNPIAQPISNRPAMTRMNHAM
jgi:hypothetical protein